MWQSLLNRLGGTTPSHRELIAVALPTAAQLLLEDTSEERSAGNPSKPSFYRGQMALRRPARTKIRVMD